MSRARPGPPRGVLTRAEPRGKIAHDRLAPSPDLEPYIAHYWSVRWDLRGEAPVVAETLPHPCVHLLFERGRGQVSGIHTRRFTRKLVGEDRVFGIKFRPAAFQPVLGEPLSRISERVLALRTIFGAKSAPVQRAILAEPEPYACQQLAEEFLRAVLPPMPAEIARMRDVVEQLAEDVSITRVEQVASLAKLDVRTLQRRFKSAVGVSPKWVIQRYRLHEAAAQLDAPEAPDLANLAAELGYFDQAHFIRDFKAVVGRAPGAYAARARGRG